MNGFYQNTKISCMDAWYPKNPVIEPSRPKNLSKHFETRQDTAVTVVN